MISCFWTKHNTKILGSKAHDQVRPFGKQVTNRLFDQLKIDDDKLADEEDNFLLSAVSDQALILPFFSDEAVTISEVVLCPASDYFQLFITIFEVPLPL